MASTARPLVSVVIPTYYREERLRAALDSVRAQTYDPIEVVVVDGADEADARPVVSEYDDATYLLQSDHQSFDLDGVNEVAAARDLGVEFATGEYVRFLDDDDRLVPEAIERQVDRAEAVADARVVYCGTEIEGGGSQLPAPDGRGHVLEQALRFQLAPTVPSTMLVDRSLFDDVPPMRTLPHDDASLVVEFALRTSFEFVDEPLVVRGEPDDALRSSWSSLEGRRGTIDAYDDLYDRYPDEVRDTALGRVYLQQGILTLQEDSWSVDAIRSFALANYHSPSLNPTFLGAFVASLFGKPAWDAATQLFNAVAGDTKRGNVGSV